MLDQLDVPVCDRGGHSPQGRGVPVPGGGAHEVGGRCARDGSPHAHGRADLQLAEPRGDGVQARQPDEAGGEAQPHGRALEQDVAAAKAKVANLGKGAITNAFFMSNEWPWRLVRTIVQDVLGVVVASVDMLVGCAVLAPEWRPIVAALVMAVLSGMSYFQGRD